MTNNLTQPDIVALINEIIELERADYPLDFHRRKILHTALSVLLDQEQFARLEKRLNGIALVNQEKMSAAIIRERGTGDKL